MSIYFPLEVLELQQYVVPFTWRRKPSSLTTILPGFARSLLLMADIPLENCLVIYLCSHLPKNQKRTFPWTGKSEFKKVMTILGKSTTVSLLLPTPCSPPPHIVVRSLNQTECPWNPTYSSSANSSFKCRKASFLQLPRNMKTIHLQNWRRFAHPPFSPP